ncbi:hypothetical protein LCGC14_2212460 [marine sediment metagenome]|uniref:Uncharacterized protein n=1 Tax=marine sediment metagenome TaxID=412755 RepID=A0A0F9E0U2_9ZZZZ
MVINRCPFVAVNGIKNRCTSECQFFIEESESCAIPVFMDNRNDILQSMAESLSGLNDIMLNIAGTLINIRDERTIRNDKSS